jgi:predicted RNase H-like HicB family nuclease
MTQGETIEDAKNNLKEAIQLILACEKEDSQNQYRGQRFLRRKIAMI